MLVAALLAAAAPATGGDRPPYRPIRWLAPRDHGRHFGAALAAFGSHLLIGSPNLDGAGTTDAYVHRYDPATSAWIRDFRVDADDDRWRQFSVGSVGPHVWLGIAPGTDAAPAGGFVTLFDGETGEPRHTWCCGALAIAVGEHVLVGGEGGGTLHDPATGGVVRSFTMPDPNRRGVLAMARVGRTIALAAASPVGVHLFDERTGRKIGFVGTRHGDARRFGSALAANGATLAVTEIPQVNLFDLGFGIYLGTIDPPSGLGGASFGTALAWADGLLAVGAPSGGGAGAVHLFDASGALVDSLRLDGAPPSFGRAVVALGRSIAVGAPTEHGGEVVIFSPCGDGVVDAPVEQCDGGGADPDCDDHCRMVGNSAAGCGDADRDGGVSLTDAVHVLRAAAGLSSPCTLERCDTDGTGDLGVGDGVRVLRFVAGLPSGLACPLAAATGGR